MSSVELGSNDRESVLFFNNGHINDGVDLVLCAVGLGMIDGKMLEQHGRYVKRENDGHRGFPIPLIETVFSCPDVSLDSGIIDEEKRQVKGKLALLLWNEVGNRRQILEEENYLMGMGNEKHRGYLLHGLAGSLRWFRVMEELRDVLEADLAVVEEHKIQFPGERQEEDMYVDYASRLVWWCERWGEECRSKR